MGMVAGDRRAPAAPPDAGRAAGFLLIKQWASTTLYSEERASFGPDRRSREFEILDVALLRLRFQIRCGLLNTDRHPD
jgi:hypothetical protein